MSRERFQQAANELGVWDDPALQALCSLLYASDTAHKKQVNDELARIGRMHKALGDEVVGFGERRRGD